MEFNEKVLDIIAEVADDDIVKSNPDIHILMKGLWIQCNLYNY